MSGTIVLKIPDISTTFHAAVQALQNPLPATTYEARQEILSRVRGWCTPEITILLEDAAYIPLRTDWMPNGTRRTADGVEVLLAGRWPEQVQAAIAAGQFARVSGRIVAEFWKCIAACSLSEESDEKQSEAPARGSGDTAGVVLDGVRAAGPAKDPEMPVGVEEVRSAAEPIIPDAEINAATPWSPDGGEDTLTPIVKTLEHYGARFRPGFFDRPIEEVRAGLKEAARSENVRETHRREQEAKAAASAKARFDSFYSVNTKTGAVSLHYSDIADYIAETLHAVTYRGMIYVYDQALGIHRLNDNDVEQMTQDIAERCGFTGRITTAKREVLSYVSAKDVRRDYPFNRCPGIPCANGVVVVDYVTGERLLVPHQPENLYTYQLPVAFDPEARADEIDAVIASWVDEDARPTLYQIPAQALLQATVASKPYKKSYIIHGDTNAAKSSYLELLRRVFGDGNTSRVMLQRIGQDRFCLAGMEGKLFNIYDDLDDVPMQNSTVLKTLTGFDMHDVEKKGIDSYRAKIFAVHVYTCNRPPETPERVQNDAAFWERWEYVTFPNYFAVDPGWYDRVLTPKNCSAFLNRVLDYAIEIMDRGGLVVKSNAYDVRDRWKTNSDPIYKFVTENMDRNETGHVLKQEMYDAFLAFAHVESVSESKIPLTLDMFAQAIFKYGFSPARVRIDKKRVYVFQGYVWKSGSQYKPRGTIDSTLVGGVV